MSDLFQKIMTLRISLSLKFIIGCSLILVIALSISFYITSKRQERLIMEQVEREARAIFEQIIIARRWVADHGGVFVERLPGVYPNPYLKDIKGIKSEIVDVDGTQYVKRNPAMVTKELSRYAEQKGLYWFHITSLNLINQENAPDGFERAALLAFEKNGLKEFISIDTINNSNFLRYISPLYIEEACLECHAHQGYKIGDIRGAISVTIPVDKTFAAMSANRKNMFAHAMIITLLLMSAMFLMMNKIVLTPMRRLKSAIRQFSEGTYSPEKRLKTGDEFEDVCRAFAEMADTLTEYHSCLNGKIKAATKDLEEMNSKLLETNRLLSEANANKSDFIAKASHELRTPLTSIKGAMDYISAKLSSHSRHHPEETSLDDLHIFFEVIKRNSERLIRMVNIMLDLERIEAAKSEMNFTSSNLSYLIAETMTNLQINADEKGIILNACIPDNLTVFVDEDRIRQVIINLLSNAIKFGPHNSEITINAYQNNSYVVTEICDEGPGIPASEHQKVFEKFYKNGNKEGTGLGLTICKAIIEAHSGVIGVKSPYNGPYNEKSGSCFYFMLPLWDETGYKIGDERNIITDYAFQHDRLLEITKKIATPC
jgi:signal transduction histidine kinase